MPLLKSALAKDFILTIVFKVFGLFLVFFIEIFLARILGISVFGEWSLAFTWISFFVIVALAGNDTYILKMSLAWTNVEARDYYKKFFWQSFQILFVLGILFLTSTTLVKLNIYNSDRFRNAFVIAILYGFFNAWNQIIYAFLTSKFQNHKVELYGRVLGPLFRAFFLLIIYKLYPNNYLLLLAFIFAEAIIYLINRRFYLLQFPNIPQTQSNLRWSFKGYFLFTSVAYFLFSSLDLIMLSFWYDRSSLGGYAVAAKVALLTGIFCSSFISFLSNIAGLFSKGNVKRIEKDYLIITKIIMVLTLPLVAVLISVGKFVLGIYGPDFMSFYPVLVILILAQMFEAITGPIGSILNMTKNEKYESVLAGLLIFVNIGLGFLLIPKYGTRGAAIAVMIAVVLLNIGKLFAVHHLLSIKTFSLKHLWFLSLLPLSIFLNKYFTRSLHDFSVIGISIIINFVIFFCLAYLSKFLTYGEIRNLFNQDVSRAG